MLAVKVDYDTKEATIGSAPGQPVPRQEVLQALAAINYRGRLVADGEP